MIREIELKKFTHDQAGNEKRKLDSMEEGVTVVGRASVTELGWEPGHWPGLIKVVSSMGEKYYGIGAPMRYSPQQILYAYQYDTPAEGGVGVDRLLVIAE